MLGLALAAAPAVFQMFTRAPKGGVMLDEFRPYMTQAQIDDFRGYMTEIGAAAGEVAAEVVPATAAGTGSTPAAVDARFPAVTALTEGFPAIEADMLDMLDTMEANLGNYAAVDALPPFPLFPWFFVLPGLMIAGVAVAGLRRLRRGAPARRHLVALAVLGVALIAAPAVFQMFTRAPKGGDMINEFRPLMTTERVTTIQGYFLTIGAGEGAIRTQLLPLAGPEVVAAADDVAAFLPRWPTISREMAPMIGAMSDNVDNFAAVDALPPFPLFPWFFVLPGVIVAALALAARRSLPAVAPPAPGARLVPEGRPS